jgi:hypothetical protein
LTPQLKFDIRRVGPLKEYVGCSVVTLPDGSMKIVQPDIIKNLERAFGNIVMDMRNFRTPMGPGITVSRPKENDETIGPTDQQKYRSGVGMLLYLVKLSRPDVSNAVRELSKVMDGATSDHVEMLHRVIKFVLITRERGVLINPNLEREVHAFVDSDYAGDSDNRRSITGYTYTSAVSQ